MSIKNQQPTEKIKEKILAETPADSPIAKKNFKRLASLYAYKCFSSGGTEIIDRIYQDMLESVLRFGIPKTSRGHETLAIPGYHMVFDLSTGNFPLLGLKYTHMPLIAAELYGFLHGFTAKHQFHEYNCHIWDEWCNPAAVPQPASLEKKKATDDLGPIYGRQWRAFNVQYNQEKAEQKIAQYPYSGQGPTDQVQTVLDSLLRDPHDRRMVVSAWNPAQTHLMALPPCHILWNVIVNDGHLSLHWHQRSCDLLLGVPFNIASYALLTLLLAKHASLKPGLLFASFADFHIYSGKSCDHTIAAHELLTRPCKAPPQLEPWSGTCGLEVASGETLDFQFWHWKPDQYDLRNYVAGPRIKLPVAV